MKDHKTPSDLNKEEEKLPQFLEQLKSQDPFDVPEGYFDSLPDAIMDKVRKSQKEEVPVRHLTKRSIYVITALAAVLGGIFLLFFLLTPDSKKDDYGDLALILQDKEAIMDYLINNTNVSDEEIFSVMSKELCNKLNVIPHDSIPPAQDTTAAAKPEAVPFKMDSTISKDDILQYLIDQGVEVVPTY